MKRIISLPNSNLRKKSRRIVDFKDPMLTKLIKDMEQATLNWEDNREHEVGVALAAVQINELYRMIIIRDDFNDKTNRRFNVYINPEIVKREGDIIDDFEGCLSIKNIYGKVPRHERVRVKALDLDGRVIRLKAEGFLARVFQHEIDHINGIMFVDYIKDKPEAFFLLDGSGKLEEMDIKSFEKQSSSLWD